MKPISIINDTVNDTDMAHTRDIFLSRRLLKGKSNIANKVANATGIMMSCPIQIIKAVATRQNSTRDIFTRKDLDSTSCMK